MKFTKCHNCNEYHFDNEKCKPIFWVTHDDYLGDQEKKVRAYDHEDAAERYAVYYNEDSAEYSMMQGEEIEIQIRSDKETEKKTFVVSAEPSIRYSTREVKPNNTK